MLSSSAAAASAAAEPDSVLKTATCSGEKGCGKEFAADDVGPEKLCTTCFKKSEEGDDEKNKSAVTEAGKAMGLILSNVRDVGVPLYDVECGSNVNSYKAFIDDQDNITGKTKKFFSLVPDPTPLLYGYKHYHGLLNKSSGRGWIAHCRLSSSKLGAEGSGYLLWEIWETRCDRPRLDGVLIRPDGEVVLIKHFETWLIENELSSDADNAFDEEYHAK
jgi:hypothetical protein